MRSTWTDSRLDDLSKRVDDLSKRVDDLSKRVDGVRDDVRGLRGEMQAEFREVRGEIGALKLIIIQIGWGLFGTVVVGMLGLIGTQL